MNPTRACRLDELSEWMPRYVEIGGRGVLVCLGADGRVFAIDELCPHEDKSMRFGALVQGRLVCPHHSYGFDLETGKPSVRRCDYATTYPVEVRGEDVYVTVPSAERD